MGIFSLKVPAQSSLFSRLDRASGHFRRYDEKDLGALMKAAGYETVSLKKINPVGALIYRLKSGKNTELLTNVFDRPTASDQHVIAVNQLFRWSAVARRTESRRRISKAVISRQPYLSRSA